MIVKIGDTPVDDAGDVSRAVTRLRRRAEVPFTILRNGNERQVVVVTLGRAARLEGRRAPCATTMTAMSELSHVGADGAVHMVDVGWKPLSRRRAVARATVLMAAETVARLGELPKGDALTTAQLAGIMAAKRTSELIPLCHPLPLTAIDVTAVDRAGRRRDRGGRRDDRADRGRDGGADGGLGRRPDGVRHGEGDRQGR